MSIQYIWCWDSNSQPSEQKSPPITINPELPTLFFKKLLAKLKAAEKF